MVLPKFGKSENIGIVLNLYIRNISFPPHIKRKPGYRSQ